MGHNRTSRESVQRVKRLGSSWRAILALFVLTYDLVKNKDYDKLITELERLEAAKIALSVWFLEVENTAGEVRDHLMGFIDDDDKLVVIEFEKKPRYSRGFKTGAAWIDARFPG